jgi:predicted TPR repeat methyltransferase
MEPTAQNQKKAPIPARPEASVPLEEFRRAVDCFNNGRLTEAAALFERIIEAEPQNSEAHYNLGLVRYYQDSFAEAESCFRQALRSNPANADAHYNLGRLLGQINRPAEAAVCYLEVLEANPDDVESHYNLGGVLKDLGMLDEAISCFEQALKIDPQYGPAHGHMGVVLHMQGREEEAIAAYRKASSLGNDSPSNRHILNALTGILTDCPPDRYVTNLFDGYALRFDESLVAMGYEIPMFLRRALDSLPGPTHFARAVDLGCGTGFSSLPFREKIGHLTGVDLSSRMLEVARGKEIYDRLHQENLVEFLGRAQGFYDLFLLTDVCVYLGKLDPVFAMIRQRSQAGALVLFSIELNSEADFALRSSGRYAHSRSYIERLATGNDMVIEHQEVIGIRKEKEKWIDGVIYILKRV